MRAWLTLLAFGVAAEAQAQPGEILFDAPAGCPDRAAFIRLVEEHGDGVSAGPVAARVTARRQGGRWTVTVELADAPVRTFEGATCAEVADAAALVIALARHLPVPVPVPDPDPDPDPDSVPDPDPRPKSSPVPVPVSGPAVAVGRAAPPAPRRSRVDLRAGALADAGTLPAPSVAATGSIAMWRGVYGLELSFSLFRARQASVTDSSSEVAPIGLWTAGLRGCRAISFAALCFGGEAGRMSGAGTALADGDDRGAFWSALSASGWVHRSIGRRAGVYAGIEAVAAALRPRFLLDDDTLLHRPVAAARALVGLELDVR